MSHTHAHPNDHATEVPAPYHEAITSQRKDLTQLGPCFREFMTHFSARAALAGVVGALALRLAIGDFGLYDITVPLIILAIQPFTEWFIHKFLLHQKPFEIRGKKYDLYSARAHRRHHKSPAQLDRVLLKAPEILVSMAQIAIAAAVIVLAITAVLGDPFLPVYAAAMFWSYVGLYRYEWTHFLIHTPYVPKTRFYRSIWKSHRLHHFKHEDYWLGVTSNASDRVLGTFPDQKDVPRSKTARTLGVDVAN